MGRVIEVVRGNIYEWSLERVDAPEACERCGKSLADKAVFTDGGGVYCGERCMVEDCGSFDEESEDDALMRRAFDYERGF
jgi:hypothetical protein